MVDRANRARRADGRFANEQSADPEAVRVDYEADLLSLSDVCLKHDLSMSKLRRMVVRKRWRQRQPRRIDRHDLIMRMFRMLDHQIRELETNMTSAGADEAAVLGRLVTTLDKLIAMKDAEARKHPTPRRSSKAVMDIRNKVAERLAQLNAA